MAATPPSEKFRRWAEQNPEAYAQKSRRYHAKLRQDVIGGYGGKCECCGNDFLPHLTIDHVNGGGEESRRASKSRSKDLYRVLRRMLPTRDPEYQVLCYNCNAAKHFCGVGRCPCQDGEG